MNEQETIVVVDQDGVEGVIQLEHPLDTDSDERVMATFSEGRRYLIPVRLLVLEGERYRLPVRVAELEAVRSSSNEIVIPVIEERLTVDRREVPGATLRVHKTIHERQVVLDEPIGHDEYRVRRVPVGRFVDKTPSVRHEGETMIIPVLEEVLIVEKKLRLKEEIHITKQRVEEPQDAQEFTIREEEVTIEREEPPESQVRRSQ